MDKICRACMNNSNIMVSIFAPLKNTLVEEECCICMADILNEIAGFQLVDKQNDLLSQYICSKCITKSELALGFKRMIQRTHQQLLDVYNSVEDDESIIKVEESVQSNERFEDICNTFVQEDESIVGDCKATEYDTTEENKTHSYNTRHKKEGSVTTNRSRDRSSSSSKKISCPYCNITLSFKGNLKTHIRIHTGERPFQCSYCPKAFIQKQNLTQHERTHTGERPLKCPVCPKAYAHLSGITVHFRKHPDHGKNRLDLGKIKETS